MEAFCGQNTDVFKGLGFFNRQQLIQKSKCASLTDTHKYIISRKLKAEINFILCNEGLLLIISSNLTITLMAAPFTEEETEDQSY